MSVDEFERELENARCEQDCERLLRIVLPHVPCTERQRDDLVARAMFWRFHFALTAEGSPASDPANVQQSFAV